MCILSMTIFQICQHALSHTKFKIDFYRTLLLRFTSEMNHASKYVKCFFVQTVCSPPLGSGDMSSQTGGYVMTNEQKERIAIMRQDGCGYSTIAKFIGLSKNSVKTYCRTHDIAGIKAQTGYAACGRFSRRICCRTALWCGQGKREAHLCHRAARQKGLSC